MIKILYVEDEVFLAKIVKESLESRGFQVNLQEDGNTVMDAFHRFQPDICVLDIMLPHQDGILLAKSIKDLHPEMPILFLTAKTQAQDVVEGFKAGGNDYIRKPFSMEELILRIQNLLQLTHISRKENQENKEYWVGTFRFHPLRQTLISGDQEYVLSHRETQLLNYLYEQKNDVIDRSLLLKSVWGDDSIFNSRNLDVYINKLRNYLNADPGVEIRTLKGVGYRFILPQS
ncbi:MAG TPA: response regulator transcription factor [Saprospiraceae bacterium]|nr:response regulator transcription factor [Saprospiraceae bacterium]